MFEHLAKSFTPSQGLKDAMGQLGERLALATPQFDMTKYGAPQLVERPDSAFDVIDDTTLIEVANDDY